MTRRRFVTLCSMLVVMLLIVGCDQGTKSLARSYLGQGNVVSLFGGVLVMRYVENQGAFLSLGALLPQAARRTVFVAFPLVILGALIAFVARKKDIRVMFAAGLAFVAGGGLGNLLDRVVHDGRVGDFLNLGVGGVRTGIFNLADLCIMVGCLLLVLGEARRERHQA
ncbi:MAG TPA: signal peptidase II [Spirochaetia bacterium]|nr:signal peptidase II [Spirochaetia bacterium]